MKRLVEVPLEDGSSILVEMEQLEGSVVRASVPGEIERAGQTLESALDAVRPTVSAIVKKISDMPFAPDETSVDFGLNLKADTSGMLSIFISAGTETNFKVSFTWKKQIQK